MLERAWYEGAKWTAILRPLSLLYGWLHQRRKLNYLHTPNAAYKSKLPVVVVGNITAGGTGKTPIVMFLVKQLLDAGSSPAILSRGYGGSQKQFPHLVSHQDKPSIVGDEPFMVFKRYGVPVVIDPMRARSARWVEENLPEVDVLIMDDGYQHYGIQKDYTILVVDGQRGFGNQRLIPEGPLREPLTALSNADIIFVNGHMSNELKLTISKYHDQCFEYQLKPDAIRNALHLDKIYSLNSPEATASENLAVAGIGNPNRFFETLNEMGLSVSKRRIFKDHHNYTPNDLQTTADNIFMTEKDWVKVSGFATDSMWFLPVEASLPNDADHLLKDSIFKLISESRVAS